jgi:dolichol-phosphate mannosyltransferase
VLTTIGGHANVPDGGGAVMRVAVVIPTYQEAENIRAAIEGVRRALPGADVVVVDDSSPDGTASIAGECGADVIVRARREGLGAAYRTGWAHALARGFDVVVSMDADGSHDPNALPAFMAAIEQGADLVMGSRYVAGGQVPGWPAHRRWLSKGGSRYAKVALGLPVHDATGGFRAYRATLLRSIGIDTLQASGYGFQIELALRTTRLGGRIVEVPITFVDRRLGTSKMHGGIILEALVLVTRWAVRDRVLHRGAAKPAEAPALIHRGAAWAAPSAAFEQPSPEEVERADRRVPTHALTVAGEVQLGN